MYASITLIGRLGRDPELRYSPRGIAVCNFPVAVNRVYTNANGEQVKETTWFRVSTWGKLAEICNQYLRQGQMVLVEGRLIPDPKTGGPRIYTRSDGTPGATFEVRASVVRFLSPRGQREQQGTGEVSAPSPTEEEDIDF